MGVKGIVESLPFEGGVSEREQNVHGGRQHHGLKFYKRQGPCFPSGQFAGRVRRANEGQLGRENEGKQGQGHAGRDTRSRRHPGLFRVG